ncbi:hypothetical protein HY413_02650 [Candidatus Kaiserbacteria bacterium]|nr:hypothetical protein [Candidatus Kaiserbacteria bacterium]
MAMIVFAGAVAAGATGAFFSDTETSTGNTFTAGEIDLSIGSQFSSASNGNGLFTPAADNDGRTLYTFDDLKPGDSGQGSFQVSVTSNESYLCARSTVDGMPENTINEAETDALDTTDGPNEGELQNYLQFAIFNDANGNGAFDTGEPLNVNQDLPGDGNGFTAQEMAAAGWIPAADTTFPNTWLIQTSLTPDTTYNAGFMYCFGNFDSNGACLMPAGSQDNAQTDGLSGSIEFQAIQTRNNPDFQCTSLNNPV